MALLKGKVQMKWKDRGYKALVLKLTKSGDSKLEVGLLGERAEETYPGSGGRITVGEVGLINEYGTDHIPSRPFMRPELAGWKSIADEYLLQTAERYATAAPQGSGGLGDAVIRRELGILGEKIRGLIIGRIMKHPPPPNAPATIRRKGDGLTLLDLHMLVNAISYRVEVTDRHYSLKDGEDDKLIKDKYFYSEGQLK